MGAGARRRRSGAPGFAEGAQAARRHSHRSHGHAATLRPHRLVAFL